MQFSQGVYRFRPDGSDFEFVTGSTNNTWGLGFSETFDVFGSTANNDPSFFVAIANRYFDGVEGLKAYLLGKRRDAFVHQFCRKLLGFALGRGVQLSDEPLLAEIQAKLAANQYRVSIAIESIVLSRQFREIRGRDAVIEE